MQAKTEARVDAVKRLRECVNDLISVLLLVVVHLEMGLSGSTG